MIVEVVLVEKLTILENMKNAVEPKCGQLKASMESTIPGNVVVYGA